MRRILSILLAVLVIASIAVGVSAQAYAHEIDYVSYEPSAESSVSGGGETFLICLGIGLVLALIVVGVMAAQLKSVRYQNNAGNYIRSGSMQVTHSRDLFLYQNTIRHAKPQNKK